MTKEPVGKSTIREALGIPEKNSVVVPVKMGPSLKKVLVKVSERNVSGWVRDAIKEELKRRYRL